MGAARVHLPVLMPMNPFNPPDVPDKFVWTSSSLKTFRDCKRMFFWKYLLRLSTRARPIPLIIGSSFHSCIAEWYMKPNISMARIAKKYQDEMFDTIETEGDYYDEDELGKFKAQVSGFMGMMNGYEEMYHDDRKKWGGKVQTEKEFQVDLETHYFAGKVDLIVPNSQKGRVSIGEHKSTFRIDDTYIERLALDTQVRGYIFGARKGLKLDVADVIYDVVRKSNLRRKANEHIDEFAQRVELDYDARPAWYFYREELKFSTADVNAFELAMAQTNAEYKAIKGLDPNDWTPNDSICKKYNRMCPYFTLCSHGLDKGTGKMYEQKDTVHEELLGPLDDED
jgi:hypothetical protein